MEPTLCHLGEARPSLWCPQLCLVGHVGYQQSQQGTLARPALLPQVLSTESLPLAAWHQAALHTPSRPGCAMAGASSGRGHLLVGALGPKAGLPGAEVQVIQMDPSCGDIRWGGRPHPHGAGRH